MTQGANDMVTKATAVAMLTEMGNVTHRSLGAGWSGVEAIVSDQEDPEVALPGLADFSLVELCLAGTMKTVNRFDGLATPAEGTYRPGALFFIPPGRRVDCFSRAFKAATGTTPHQVLIERRVARARERLEHGTDPIVDVALECGFSSQAHMTSTFTRQLGVSPGRYRKERRR